jgi:hypothetical protein
LNGASSFVDNQNLIIEGRAILPILLAGYANVGTDIISPLYLFPPFAECRSVQGHALPDNSNQPAVILKPFQSLLDVTGANRRVALTLHTSCR